MIYDRNGVPIVAGSVLLGVRVGDVSLITDMSREFGLIWLHYTIMEVTRYCDAGFRGQMQFKHGRVVSWFEVLR